MIKYSELQIGDWVIVDGTPRQIQAITKKKIGYHRKENEPRLYYARLHDVEPIEITEEILRKNEFQYKDKPIIGSAFRSAIPYRALVYEGYSFLIEVKNGGYTWVSKKDKACDTMCETHYVHELQHAIRLCGVNFEVKL